MKPGPWEELQLFDTVETPSPFGERVNYTTQARELFDLWRETYQPRAKWSDVRGRRLIKGIKEFGYDDCRAAILGMQYSDWHMGKNKAGQKYTEVRVALRNEDSVIRFSELYHAHQGQEVYPEPERWTT